MAALSRVVLVLLICWVQRCSAQDPPPSILTLNPTLINLTPNTTSTGTSVTVSCSPPGAAAGKQLFALNIKKKPINSPESTTPTLLVEALSGADKAKLKPSMSGATATGSVSDRIIRLVMSKASCSDEAMYICVVTYYNSGPVTAKSEAELKAEVAPAQLTMTVTPTAPLPPASTWKVNNTLTMSCVGPVGSVNTSGSTNVPQINWQWEYRDDSSSWSPYSGDPGDIKKDNFLTPSCYKTQRSTLTRRLTLKDSGRQYRCYIRRGLTGFDQYADTYTVGTVTSDGVIPPPDDPSEPAKADVGAIVGGLFGALIVIAVIVIIVYFLVIRPRRQRQAEEDVDGGPEKGGDKAAVPPNAELGDPTVDYSQPHRRPKDKNKPPKHAGHQDGRWDDRDRDRGESSKNAEGLHYADLDLMRNPPRDERIPPVRPPRGERNPPPRGERNPAPRGERNPPGQETTENSRGGGGGNTPTEYASIRLY